MPSVSRAQQRLMQAAAHGATFAKAKHVRASMTPEQLHDFAAGSMKGKPAHAPRTLGEHVQRASHRAKR